MNPRFEGGIPDFMDGIPDFMDVVLRKVHWRNPRLKSLNSMPVNGIQNLSKSRLNWEFRCHEQNYFYIIFRITIQILQRCIGWGGEFYRVVYSEFGTLVLLLLIQTDLTECKCIRFHGFY